ncbi:hypothetical protein LINPERHAP2_LOCUS33470 [Linum perenne]
MGGDSLAHL